VLTGKAPRTYQISGIVTFGSADNLAGETLAGLYLPAARPCSTPAGITTPSTSWPSGRRQHHPAAGDRQGPAGRGRSCQRPDRANELSSAVSNTLSVLSTLLLVFALISLFVGAFTIFNTFSITVAQRVRELALLRVVGASRASCSARWWVRRR